MMKPKPIHELAPGLTQSLTPEQWAKVDADRAKERAKKEASKPAVRVLSDKEMAALHGRGPLRNKYLLGTLPWQRSLRDANLCTGNLFKSFTDIQVSPAKGAGLALQRTYNSNDDRPGPFGIGWTHAYDIRMEEAQDDPVKDFDVDPNPDPAKAYKDTNFTNRADFFGHKHRYHRDADGLYTPPAYLFDELDSNYNKFLVGDPIVQASVNSDDQHSMDGTVKHFELIGNSRVCKSITDRYNNVTTLAYDPASIAVPLLQTVTDPSGRVLTFRWHDFQPNPGAGQDHAWRIVQVDGPQYSVVYTYGVDMNNLDTLYNLTSVTLDASTPTSTGEATGVIGGAAAHTPRTTTFTYGHTAYDQSVPGQVDTGEYGLLMSITDPQGQQANEPGGGHTVTYAYQTIHYKPYSSPNEFVAMPTNSIWIYSITEVAGYDTAASTPKLHAWYLAPYISTQPFFGSAANFMSVTFQDSDPYAQIGDNADPLLLQETLLVDTQLRALACTDDGDRGYFATSYDSSNNVTMTNDLVGLFSIMVGSNLYAEHSRTENFTYGPHGNQLTHWTNTDPADTTKYYNASQYFQKKSVTDANGRTTTFIVGDNQGVDPSGQAATSDGNKGSVLFVQDADYGKNGTPSFGRQFAYVYDTVGRKTSETDLNGVTTLYTYGGLTGDQVDATNAAGRPVGNLTQVTRDYDAAGTRLNLKTRMAYDVVGHVTESVDPKGNKSDFTYTNGARETCFRVK